AGEVRRGLVAAVGGVAGVPGLLRDRLGGRVLRLAQVAGVAGHAVAVEVGVPGVLLVRPLGVGAEPGGRGLLATGEALVGGPGVPCRVAGSGGVARVRTGRITRTGRVACAGGVARTRGIACVRRVARTGGIAGGG